MADPTNAGPSTQPNPDDERALFAEAQRLMDEARPQLTPEQTSAAQSAFTVAPRRTEAQQQAWRERGVREWATEAPDRAAMALAIAVAGCEAALSHAEALGVLRLFDDAALDPFATLVELAEGKEGRWGAAPDPEAQREKERLFAAARELLEARRDELVAADERRYDPRTVVSHDLQTWEDWKFHVWLHGEGRRMDREDAHEFRSGESSQLLRQARAFLEPPRQDLTSPSYSRQRLVALARSARNDLS
jgi:hypothetical protein